MTNPPANHHVGFSGRLRCSKVRLVPADGDADGGVCALALTGHQAPPFRMEDVVGGPLHAGGEHKEMRDCSNDGDACLATGEVGTTSPKATTGARRQSEARRVVDEHYPFACCAVCGLQLRTCLTVAHLDQDPGNNAPDNLARLCLTHHWMYDAGLYSVEAIRLLQAHWQIVKGEPCHKARMKDAGAKAGLRRKRRAAARKAVTTRRQIALSE